MSTATLTDPTAEIAVLRSKAAGLRATATTMEGPLQIAYLRRAAELELKATALAARLGLDEPLVAAA